jgi:DnaA family protein
VRQLLLDLALPAAPTLENFAIGRNGELLHALGRWLSGDSDLRALYLWGPAGSGKTHLLSAAVAAAQARGQSARYVTGGELATMELPEACACVAVDDIHALDAAGQAVLFGVLNRCAHGELRALLAAQIAPAGLPLRDDVRTRAAAALVLQLHPLSDEEKVQALQAHAHSRGFELPGDAATYLLRHGRRDLRWLLALLDALDRYSLQVHRAITVPLLREVLAHESRFRQRGE